MNSSMSIDIMHRSKSSVQSKSFDTGSDLYPIYSPTSPSTSPSSSTYQSQGQFRRRKLASESTASDLFRRSFRHASPDSSADSRMIAMPEEGIFSSPDEDPDPHQSTRSIGPGYLLLSAKDRLKSASLEWSLLSNGSVTPRATHYHTHPPLDFKSLKQKLEQLTGSRDDVSKKYVSGHDRRKRLLTRFPAVTTPAALGDGASAIIDTLRKTNDPEMEAPAAAAAASAAAAGADFFKNVPYVSTEPLLGVTYEEIDSKPIEINFGMNSINLQNDSDPSDRFQWSDLAQHVAQNDGKLKNILRRHYEEREDLKRQHETQWRELHQRISESSSSEDIQQTETKLQPEELRAITDERGKDQLSLLSSDVVFVPTGVGLSDSTDERGKDQLSGVGLSDSKGTAGRSFEMSIVIDPQPHFSPTDEINGDNAPREDIVRSMDGADGKLSAAGGVPQQVRSLPATPTMTMFHRQIGSQTVHQIEPHIWRQLLVDRTLQQLKFPPSVEPLNWFQQLELLQRLQAAQSLEQRIQQTLPQQQMSLLEAAIRQTQNQSLNFDFRRFPNHQQCTYCPKPCIQERVYPAEPPSTFNLNGRSGIGYSPNYAQTFQFPQQSPCSEVSSYYCPDNLSFASNKLCCSPNEMACLLEAASRNNVLPGPPPFTMTPQQMPLLSHLVAGQSPLCLDSSYPSFIRPSALPGLSLLQPHHDLHFPETYTTTVPDIRQLIYSPLNPFAT